MKYGFIVITADCSVSLHWCESRNLDLALLHELVGGYVESVRVRGLPSRFGDVRLLCDEDGKMKGKPLNKVASVLYGNPYDCIVGDVVVCLFSEFPEPDLYAFEEASISEPFETLRGMALRLRARK